jgi:hypothetical protein
MDAKEPNSKSDFSRDGKIELLLLHHDLRCTECLKIFFNDGFAKIPLLPFNILAK